MDKKRSDRKRKSTDDAICKYGSLCYRKNLAHRKKYHSESISERIEDKNSKRTDSSELEESDDIKTCSENVVEVLDGEIESLLTDHKFTETVADVLKGMPEDFFEFWNFCSSINKSNPEKAFEKIGLHLVGVYDLLAQKIPKEKKVELHTHWRYYYDPPEFQTVVKSDGDDLYHIGYFRDEPSEYPSILASNSAKKGPHLSLKGDNIFAAMNAELTERMKKLNSKTSSTFSKIQEKLQKRAEEKKYNLSIQSSKTKARNKKVVAKTFHGLGIVVPLENDVGYRPLPDSDATMKLILRRIVDAKTKDERLRKEEDLDEIINNVQFATDECDFGMGLELGIDLFCNGNSYFHPHILNLLTIAYGLLKRPKYAEVIKCHLTARSNSQDLNTMKIG